MTDTSIKADAEPELDEELLAEAMRGTGTTSRNETLNTVLREYVMAKRAVRRKALEDVRRMSAEGAFDWDAIEEADK